MSKPVILFCDPVSAPWAGKLRQLCALQGIRLRAVGPGDTGRTVADLAAGRDAPAVPPPALPVPEPILVLCALSESQLDRLLPLLRREKIFCLKALLTPHNAGWSLGQLYLELCRERDAMAAEEKSLQDR